MKQIPKSIRSIFIITLLIKILGLIYKMILTRILKIDGMVVYSLLTPALALSICLSSYNIQIVCNQKVSENTVKPTRKILKSAAKINIITSSLVSLCILLAFPFYKSIYDNPAIYYPLLTIIPLIFFSNFSGIMKGYLEAKKDFTIPGISNLLEQCSKIALSILFLYLFRHEDVYMKVFYAFLAMSLSEIISFTYLLYKLKQSTRIYWRRTEDNQKKEILKQATPLTLEHCIISLVSFFEPIVFFFAAGLANIQTNEATLMYALCNQYAVPLLIIAAFISTTLGKTLFPYISPCKKDLSQIKERLDLAFIITLTVSIINFNICFFHSDTILMILYGDKTSKPIVTFLAVFFFFSYYSPILVSILQASKCEFYLFIESIWLNLVGLIITFGGLFIESIGVFSLPLSIGVTSILKNISNYIYIHKNLNYKIPIRGFLLVIVILLQNILMQNVLNFNLYLDFAFSNLVSLTLIVLYWYYFHNKKRLFCHMKRK